MTGYVVRRVLSIAPIMIGVSFLVFLMLHLIPGDVAVIMADRSQAGGGPEAVARVRHELGLDVPIHEQYFRFAGRALTVVVGVGLGLLAAVYHDTWVDRVAMLLSLGGLSIPIFWSGLLLILLFAVTLRWLPITGGSEWQRLILPAAALGYDGAAFVAHVDARHRRRHRVGRPDQRSLRARGEPHLEAIAPRRQRNRRVAWKRSRPRAAPRR